MKAKYTYIMKSFRYLVMILLSLFFIRTQAGITGCKEIPEEKAATTSKGNNNVYKNDKDIAYKITKVETVEKNAVDQKEEKDDFANKAAEITPEMYGAIGDGVIRKLSSKYPTLNAAKKDYPSAQDLDITIDGAAFQKAVDEVAAKGGGQVTARKNYAINFPIETKSNVTIDGEKSGRIYNDKSRDRNILQNAFFLGDHHGVGFTPGAGSAKYKLYDVAGKISAGQNFARLSNSSDIKDFKIGQLLLLCTVAKKKVVNDNVALPYHITVCKIVKIENNSLFFEYPIDEDVDDPQIAANGSYDNFAKTTLEGVENVVIRNFTIDARSWAVRWYGYKCTIENLTLVNASEFLVGSALAYSTISNIKGTFSRRCMEIKTGTHDLVVEGIDATYKGIPDAKESRSVISIGEYNRNVIVRDFKIDMGNLQIDDPVIGLHARKATISNGEIYCRNQTGVVLRLFSDEFAKAPKYACFNNKIDNIKFYCNTDIKTFVFIGSPNPKEVPPTDNVIENCSFLGGNAKTTVLLNAGQGNTLRKSNFGKARLVKKELSKSDKLEENILAQ